MTKFGREIISNETITIGLRIINSFSTRKDHAVYLRDDDNFYKALNDKVNGIRLGSIR